MRLKGDQAFNDLQSQWNEKLRSEGFDDIEDTTKDDRPLKEWHSFKFLSYKAQIRQKKREGYQHQIDTFANDPQFFEILRLLGSHGNSKFSEANLEHIWHLHRAGDTERSIAKQMECSQSCIHFLLKRFKEWMKLIV